MGRLAMILLGCCLVHLPVAQSFINPFRLPHLKSKQARSSNNNNNNQKKLDKLQQNGKNYGVYFRPETDALEGPKTRSAVSKHISNVFDGGSTRNNDDNNKNRNQRRQGKNNQRRKSSVNIPIKRRVRPGSSTSTSPTANVNQQPFQLKTDAKPSQATTTTTPTEITDETLSPQPGDNETNSGSVCRVVTLSDGKIPTNPANLPQHLFEEPHLLRKLDSIFHAMSHEEIRRLEYMQMKNHEQQQQQQQEQEQVNGSGSDDEDEEQNLVSVVRNSLEDAGFQLLTRRDLDLCDALNAGYLLRLSIVPDVSELDDGITQEFYPEFYNTDGSIKSTEELMFEGKVLVYWRGYSEEVSRGRLLLPKLDYLQASLVQRAAAFMKRRLGSVEQTISLRFQDTARKVMAARIHASRAVADAVIPRSSIYRPLRSSLRSSSTELSAISKAEEEGVNGSRRNDSFFKLKRYGGSKTGFVGSPNLADSLEPFVISDENDECHVNNEPRRVGEDVVYDATGIDDEMNECINRIGLRCPYDMEMEEKGKTLPPMQVLERVTMSNLVDPFSTEGRQSFAKSLVSKSDLVEPTYEEVVVIWRQKEDEREKAARPVWTPPRIVYELADMFDYEGLPDPSMSSKPKRKTPLQIRTFDQVPMANLPAVMPKTKLVFRPADAFVFDFISVLTLVASFGSLKFTSPKLDLIAFLSVSLWTIRLVIRYSNKLARYDLLVKTFLTSKISHRNAGALKYLLAEAGGQRAARAALVHSWLAQQDSNQSLNRTLVLDQGMMEVNDMVKGKQVQVDISAALNDLEDIELVKYHGERMDVARDKNSVSNRIKSAWNAVLEGDITMAKLVGRRERSPSSPY